MVFLLTGFKGKMPIWEFQSVININLTLFIVKVGIVSMCGQFNEGEIY